jgi:hypothetical protein
VNAGAMRSFEQSVSLAIGSTLRGLRRRLLELPAASNLPSFAIRLTLYWKQLGWTRLVFYFLMTIKYTSSTDIEDPRPPAVHMPAFLGWKGCL